MVCTRQQAVQRRWQTQDWQRQLAGGGAHLCSALMAIRAAQGQAAWVVLPAAAALLCLQASVVLGLRCLAGSSLGGLC